MTQQRGVGRTFVALGVVAVVVLAAIGAAFLTSRLGTHTVTSVSTATFLSTVTSTSTQNFSTTVTTIVMDYTSSSGPGMVKLSGAIASQVYEPTLVSFVQDECTNVPYNQYCNSCLQSNTSSVTITATTSSGDVPVPCEQNLYSANITIVSTAHMYQNTTQPIYYGTFSVSLPNNYGYTIIQRFAATGSASGAPGFYVGYFLVDTSLPSLNEPGIECFFPSSNYSISNDICKTLPTVDLNLV